MHCYTSQASPPPSSSLVCMDKMVYQCKQAVRLLPPPSPPLLLLPANNVQAWPSRLFAVPPWAVCHCHWSTSCCKTVTKRCDCGTINGCQHGLSCFSHYFILCSHGWRQYTIDNLSLVLVSRISLSDAFKCGIGIVNVEIGPTGGWRQINRKWKWESQQRERWCSDTCCILVDSEELRPI